jgi:8-oxo-dGTP pyrophosphatase MutT (NUDIX family)
MRVNPMNLQAFTMYGRQEPDANTRVRAGVGVIVVDAMGRILLERRSDNGLWGLPGGAIHPGESVREAALREVKEETGLDIRITSLLGVYSEPTGRIVTYPDNGDVVHLVDIVFTAEFFSGKLAVSQESLELSFFSPEALPRAVVPPALQPIDDFIQGRSHNIR